MVKKPSLIKTKIVACLLMLMGISLIILYAKVCFNPKFISEAEIGAILILPIFIFIIIPIGLLLGISGFSLFMGQKWAWWFNVIIFVLLSIFGLITIITNIPDPTMSFVENLFFSILFFFYPFIVLLLLLLDRKNFFKIAS